MKRTWLIAQLLWIVAAPAAAQVQAQGDVQVGGGGGGDSAAREGFLLGARLVVAGPGEPFTNTGVRGELFGVPDTLPSYYLGYRLGALGFAAGISFASVSNDAEGGEETSGFVLGISPQIMYELTSTGRVALDIFGGPAIAVGSIDANPGDDTSLFGFGLEAGVRAIGYVLPNFGLHADLGLDISLLGAKADSSDADSDEQDFTVIGLYGAVGVMGTI